MPQSLSKVYLHLIFSTKDRRHDILPGLKEELHTYIGGTLNEMGCQSVIVGGMSDHVHLLFLLSRTKSIADVVKEIKANTTLWVKTRMGCNFAWQRGYAIFSVSQSVVDSVRNYIANQEEHHRHRTFQEEYRAFLEKYNLKFDETYVWD